MSYDYNYGMPQGRVVSFEDYGQFDRWGKKILDGKCPSDEALVMGAQIRTAAALERICEYLESIDKSIRKAARTPEEIEKARQKEAEKAAYRKRISDSWDLADATMERFGLDGSRYVKRDLCGWFVNNPDADSFDLMAENAADDLLMSNGTKYREEFEAWQKERRESK